MATQPGVWHPRVSCWILLFRLYRLFGLVVKGSATRATEFGSNPSLAVGFSGGWGGGFFSWSSHTIDLHLEFLWLPSQASGIVRSLWDVDLSGVLPRWLSG